MSSNSAVPRPSEIRGKVPSKKTASQKIRDLIDEVIEDDDFFDHICKYALPPGHAGNRQMDQAIVSEMLFHKIPKLRDYEGLNHKLLWGHVTHVMTRLGYKTSGGYITGHYLEDQSETTPETQEAA